VNTEEPFYQKKYIQYTTYLLFGGHLAREHEPQERLGAGLAAGETRAAGQGLLALGDGWEVELEAVFGKLRGTPIKLLHLCDTNSTI
jgi:hypothetical protein